MLKNQNKESINFCKNNTQYTRNIDFTKVDSESGVYFSN